MPQMPSQLRQQDGMSIIELMIAMTIGLLIMAGLANLFVQTKQSFRQDDLVARMQEDSRYAMTMLSSDMSMLGFFGPIQDPGTTIDNVGTPAGALFTYNAPLLTLDNVAGPTAFDWGGTLDDMKAGTDVVSIRRVEGSTTAAGDLVSGHYYLETNGQAANMIAGADGPSGSFSSPEFWRYTPSIYYVRTYCRPGDGIPSLVKRYTDTTGTVTDCIAAGIEDMQVEIGLDSNSDLVPESYRSVSLTTADSAAVASVRVHLLSRATRADQQYTNSKTYNLANAAAHTPNDNFYRRVYTTTVQTRNPTGFRALTFTGQAGSAGN